MAKVGRPRLFDNPDQLWDLFEQYKQHVKDNPITKREYVGRDGIPVDTPLPTPLILDGFASFCWEKWGDISHYMKGDYEEFSQVIARIRTEVRTQQVGGALAGVFNSNLTARLNGITEKQQIEINKPFVLEINEETK